METNFTLPLVGSIVLNNCYETASSEEKFNTIQLVYTRALEALNGMINLDLKLFDGLVGDQACQIRALKIISLTKEDYTVEIELLKNKIQKLEDIRLEIIEEQKILNDEKKKLYEQRKQNKITPEEIKIYDKKILENKKSLFEKFSTEMINQDILVSKDVLFITEAYFLTLIKTRTEIANSYKDGTNPKLLQLKNLNCGKITLGDESLNAMKMSLSEKSVEFVKDLAKEINYPTDCLEVRLNKRMELPFLYMTEVIFRNAFEAKIPILLKIKNIKDKAFACNILFNKSNKYSSGLIVEGFSNKSSEELKSKIYKKQLKNEGILKIISYNAAQHNQYTNCSDFNNNQVIIKKEAIEKGFSMSNPLLCCIDHVFCDLIVNQIEKKS